MDEFLAEYGIAIIGLSGRFPGAGSIQAFWENLQAGKESIALFTEEELLQSGISKSQFRKPNYVPAKGILKDIKSFDADFFNISPNDAKIMDPQQRIFLECAWEALEVAGYPARPDHPQSVGVFASSSKNTYLIYNLLSQPSLLEQNEAMQLLISNEKDYLGSRVSYKLNLTGPSISVQTACSSSLVAVHLACQSLLLEECQMALVGGVSVDVPHKAGYEYLPGHILSPDGHCRVFDQRAKGTVFGQGVGIALLKPLKAAIRDRDHIHAVIRGSAVNNDGSDKVGFTAQSIDKQAEVLRRALQFSGIKPDDISYIEAHGSSTALGDPIEVEALRKVFFKENYAAKSCAIGSVKSNVGHLNAASGITGLIKVALLLENKIIPPSINFDIPNEKINFAQSPFYVNTDLIPLDIATPKAGVSSFGIGGTNAHVILQSFSSERTKDRATDYHIVNLSARSPTALQQYADQISAHLAKQPNVSLSDLAYTLQNGRSSFPFRAAFVCQSIEEVKQQLKNGQFFNHYTKVPKRPKPLFLILPDPATTDLKALSAYYQSTHIIKEEVNALLDLIETPPFESKRLLDTDEGSDATTSFMLLCSIAVFWKKFIKKIDGIIGLGNAEPIAAYLSGGLDFQQAYSAFIHQKKVSIDKPLKLPFYTRGHRGWVLPGSVANLEIASSSLDKNDELNLGKFLNALPSGQFLDISAGRNNSLFKEISSPELIQLDGNSGLTAFPHRSILHFAAKLWVKGIDLNWPVMSSSQNGKKIPFPTHPFNRREYWVEKEVPKDNRTTPHSGKDMVNMTNQPPKQSAKSTDVNTREIIEAFLINTYKQILGHKHIGVFDNFFDLGGNSLLGTRLIADIQKQFHLNLALDTIYRYPTIEAMTSHILNLHHFPELKNQGIAKNNSKEDIFLHEDFQLEGTFQFKENPDNILLTGATGFLGCYVIKYLLERTTANIFCLIRADNQDHARKKFMDNYYRFHETLDKPAINRIKWVVGEITDPALGLAPDLYRQLSFKIDSIYHIAARISFIEPYQTIKKVNVGATRNLTSFAAKGVIKHFHYVSSIAAFNSDTFRDEVWIKEGRSLKESSGFYRGYDESKWVAEMLLEKARRKGLPITIYRPGNIIGDSHSGLLPPDSLFMRFLNGCVSLGYVPYSELFVDLEPVDFVAEALVHISLKKESINGKYHLVNEQPLKWSKMIDIAHKIGYNLQVISYDKWKKKLRYHLKQNPANPLIPLIPMFDKSPLLTGRLYDCQHTIALLSDSQISCPDIDLDFLKRYLMKDSIN